MMVCVALFFSLANLGADFPTFSEPLEEYRHEILVQPAPGISIDAISERYQADVLDSIPALRVYRLAAGNDGVLERMAQDDEIARAGWNRLAEPLEMQRRYFGGGSDYEFGPVRDDRVSSTLYYEQWPVIRLHVNQAQGRTTGAGITVAIVDTGIDLDHPELAGRLVAGYDFVDGDAVADDGPDGRDDDGDGDVDEGAGHGTHVAGIVALVAPGASLMPVRVLNSDGVGDYFDIVAGIVYAVDHGAQVINLSLSGADDADFLEMAVRYAQAQGALVVAAAGAYDVRYPARYPGVVSVGATDKRDHVAAFSDFRAGQVTVFAPGVSIYSTFYDGGYAWWTGTSMAAPFAAGEGALLLSLPGCDSACAAEEIQGAVHPVVPRLDARGRIEVFQAVRDNGRH
jgi:subtilisin family serine protease